uniref:Checkpoint protein n=1 Tax=Glossina brevipalpis TaxID=37001 RepID=A0A1A9WS12_9MUSC
MKFSAKIDDGQYMREFQNIVLTLAKLTKECVIIMKKDKLNFIANEESGSTAPLVWIEINAQLYFTNYIMEEKISKDDDDDDNSTIMLAISPIHFSRALSSFKLNARNFKFKLIHLQFPCLRTETEVISQNSGESRQIVHDVPVTVIPRNEWNYYDLPQIPRTQLIINVCSNSLLRGLIDKLKNISPTLIFEANSMGELNLVAKNELTTITTRFKKLEVKSVTTNGGGNGDDEEKEKENIEVKCSVDCKKTSLFFTALQVPTTELSCGIDDDHLIHIEIKIREGVFIHSILPGVCV